jgi:hypothetical protein
MSRLVVTLDWFEPDGRLKPSELRDDDYEVNFLFPREAGPLVRTVCPAESRIADISGLRSGRDPSMGGKFGKRALAVPRRQIDRLGSVSWSARPYSGVWICSAETLSGQVFPLRVEMVVKEDQVPDPAIGL